ncbi:hypothetical protein AB6N24_10610 [Cellulomonas sp. 179-A 4D5 NHS]|uniref:hypothetical protein n=1 Tax=Cellulomonas sp. 179-A 4D5 NHS TaxID=3142378 RepID=UPI0039A38FD2
MTTVPDEHAGRRPGTRRRARLRTGAVLGLVAAAALTGCAGQPGAAAVVDGRVIPVEDVHTAVEQLAPFFEGATSQNVLAVLVQEPTIRAFAQEHGVAVSDQAARAQLTDAAAQLEVATTEEFGEPAVAVSRYLLVWEQLTALPDAQTLVPDLQLELGELDVEVSPRFGAVDESNELVAVERPWLVTSDDETAVE